VGKIGDWSDLINLPRDENALAAPKLSKVPFLDIIVAYYHAYKNNRLNFILRGLEKEASFVIEVKDLKVGAIYTLSTTVNGKL
jgi:hypothetical protein